MNNFIRYKLQNKYRLSRNPWGRSEMYDIHQYPTQYSEHDVKHYPEVYLEGARREDGPNSHLKQEYDKYFQDFDGLPLGGVKIHHHEIPFENNENFDENGKPIIHLDPSHDPIVGISHALGHNLLNTSSMLQDYVDDHGHIEDWPGFRNEYYHKDFHPPLNIHEFVKEVLPQYLSTLYNRTNTFPERMEHGRLLSVIKNHEPINKLDEFLRDALLNLHNINK